MVLTVFAGIAEFERSLIPAQTAPGPAHRRSPAHRTREVRPRRRPDLQCPCRDDLSLPPRRGGLMTVHRSARTHGPQPGRQPWSTGAAQRTDFQPADRAGDWYLRLLPGHPRAEGQPLDISTRIFSAPYERSPYPLTAHLVPVFLAHRDAVGRGASTPSLTTVHHENFLQSHSSIANYLLQFPLRKNPVNQVKRLSP